MRTLNRPMFNWGGPVKEGIMHGIREPHAGGGRAALVGNPVFPKDKTGRAHHFAAASVAPWLYGAGRAALAGIPKIYRGFKAGRTFPSGTMGGWGRLKNIMSPSGKFRETTATIKRGGPRVPDAAGSYSPITATPGKPLGFWKAMRDPTRFGQAIRENPLTAAGLGYTALGVPRNVPNILSAGADAAKWTGRKVRDQIFGDLFKEKDPIVTVPGVPGGGETAAGSGAAYYDKTKKVDKALTSAERDAFALSERNKRVEKYLEMMGYDRSKKTAIADALIDASKIVGDRGTLDKKNITQELINPIIQATSKRLDKPEQIREAVGLMATKAEIEKDLNKETKDLDRKYKKAQIRAAEAGLEGTESFEGGMKAFISARKGKIDKTTLERIARLLANEHGETFTLVEEDTDVTNLDDGIYMSGDKLVRVTDGTRTQII